VLKERYCPALLLRHQRTSTKVAAKFGSCCEVDECVAAG
jgi:hypothetical protein